MSWLPAASAHGRAVDILFIGLVVATVLIVGALTFLPALALGPIVEQLQKGLS